MTSSDVAGLVCKGGTYPALLLYEDLADAACNRITAGITMALCLVATLIPTWKAASLRPVVGLRHE